MLVNGRWERGDGDSSARVGESPFVSPRFGDVGQNLPGSDPVNPE